jgi:valyl-tRNA synthetase
MNIDLGSIATRELETEIQKFWDENNFWENNVSSDKKPFTIMMPPPNVTGNLHMGHALDNAIPDFFARYKRMDGFDVLYQPGMDHASIAMQLMVERDLSKNGKNPRTMSREELLKAAWDWKESVGGEIMMQLHALGITPAWSRERFTMDEGLNRAVNKIFVQMYRDGLIYKGKRLVNWCPKQQTTVSDLEIEIKEEKGKFYYFKYPITNHDFIEIATTRPETMFGDKAIAVHPENEKLKHLIGQTAIIPLTDIEIPIIADEHADPEKGTGAVKITPAHDMDDWVVAQRHGLEPLCVMTNDAKMNDNVPEKYRGLDRFKAREMIIADLDAAGLLTKVEDKMIPTPYSERGKVVIEYMLRDEWFVDAKKMAPAAIKAAEDGDTKFIPEHRYNMFMSWMRDIHEWSISRQLWWGHQIPAWYDAEGNIYVAETEEEVYERYSAADSPARGELTRETSVLDTWFSSALWPFSTLGWPDKTPELKKYYPTDLVTPGPDIIFFWVARMMMMGEYAMKNTPFRTVYLHGIVRDKNGQKFSKTLGNGVDPMDTIQKFGADALRYWVATAPIGQDLRYNDEEVKRGSKLLTKLWNAAKFVLMNLKDFEPRTTNYGPRLIEDKWLLLELNKTIAETRKHMDKYDYFNARAAIDTFFYDIFADQYLEFVKDRFWQTEKYGEESKLAAQETLWIVLRNIIGLYAPFIPFQTEELWQRIYKSAECRVQSADTLHLTQYPTHQKEWEFDVSGIEVALETLKLVRGLRSETKIGNGARLEKVIVNFEISKSVKTFMLSAARTDFIEFDSNQAEKVRIIVAKS